MKILLAGIFSVLLLGTVACQSKDLPKPDSPQAYIGNWKVTDPQGQVFYMTLKADGSGTTTREGGEFGTWKIKDEHLESEWLSQRFQIFFEKGKTKPIFTGPAVEGKTQNPQPWVAERVEEIPN
jgi:hypothetical protein